MAQCMICAGEAGVTVSLWRGDRFYAELWCEDHFTEIVVDHCRGENRARAGQD